DRPEAMWDKIVLGHQKKFFSEIVLLNQPYVKDPSGKMTIGELLKTAAPNCGATEIKAYARFALGEELPGEAPATDDE
ncbi:MAG: translation elongation factor Ts, partial [Candidatus Adiutrix sp.]